MNLDIEGSDNYKLINNHIGFNSLLSQIDLLEVDTSTNEKIKEVLLELNSRISRLILQGGTITKSGDLNLERVNKTDNSIELKTETLTLGSHSKEKLSKYFNFDKDTSKLKSGSNPAYNLLIKYLNTFAKNFFEINNLDQIKDMIHPNSVVKQIMLDLITE